MLHMYVLLYHLAEVIIQPSNAATGGQGSIGLPSGVVMSFTLPFDLCRISIGVERV